MKKALVLAGGGTRGIYQAGVIEALKELGEDSWNLITGTSVGALNALMLVQHDFQAMIDMYENLTADQIINGFVPNPDDLHLTTLIHERDTFLPAFRAWVKEHGVDIAPFRQYVHDTYDPEKFFSSEIDFGCIAATAKGHEPVYITKEMMKEHGEEWLVATASAYPAFPVATIDGVEYVDGGYFDNFPIDFALRLGAEEIIAIDLSLEPTHPCYADRENIIYIHPHVELFSFLDFDKQHMQFARRIGYLDCMKKYGVYKGEKFTFIPFAMPAYYREWYRGIEMLETRIKLATNLNDRFRSDQAISDHIKEQLHVSHISGREMLYGMLDALMDLCGLSDTEVYTYTQARDMILAGFRDAVNEEYASADLVQNITSAMSVLERKNIVARLLHDNLYPQHAFLAENIVLTMYPFEQALADLLTYMLKELGEE